MGRPLRRMVRAGVARRDLRRERVLTVAVDGARLEYPSTSVIGRSLAVAGGWEPTFAVALDVMLPNGAIVAADIGSNIGVSVAQILSVRPEARVHCFEPSDRFHTFLLRNVEANGWADRVVVEKRLVGMDEAPLELFTNTSTASVARRSYGGHVVIGSTWMSPVTVDAYFGSAARLDLIKSDTDGFDAEVLLGAEGVVRRLRPVLYFEFAPFLMEGRRDPAALLEFLQMLEYRCFAVFAQDGRLLDATEESASILALAERFAYVDLLTAPGDDGRERIERVAAELRDRGWSDSVRV